MLTYVLHTDPVFFLHHVQLDRLWWMWQQAGFERIWEYNGPSSGHDKEAATIDDALVVGGLGPDIRIRDIMDAGSALLCYTY